MVKDLSEVYKKHKGEWVAMDQKENSVIASGKSVSEKIKAAREKGVEDPIFFKVPKKVIPYIGSL